MEGRTRFGEGTRPTIYFAILGAVLMLPAVLLLAFPDRALADADLSIKKEGPSPSRVEPGEQFDYVLTVSNAAGADTATNVTVRTSCRRCNVGRFRSPASFAFLLPGIP